MKRKALIMSMAMMTGMPGWAKAKSEGPMHQPGEVRTSLGAEMEANAFAEPLHGTSQGTFEMSGLLSKVRAMIRAPDRESRLGLSAKPARPANGWRMEFLGAEPLERDFGNRPGHMSHDDPRVDGVKPIGLAFRLKF